MKKNKKWVLSGILAACVVLIGVGVFFGVKYYLDNREEPITYDIQDTLSDGGGKKVTVIFLAGQSNASGCSLDSYLQKNVSPEKYEEYRAGYDNVYINYLSGNRMSGGFVKCATLQGEPEGTFGPELGLAEKLHELYPEETFFIIKCAWGGTNLFEQWRAPSSSGKTGELYRKFVAFTETSLKYLESKNYEVQVAGMCWMQGESDSFSMDNATAYKNNLSDFVGDIRKEFSQYAAPKGIAFVDAYIAANPSYWVYYEPVNLGKLEFSQSSHLNVLVDTITQGLDTSKEPEDNPDVAHYDSMSEIKLGHLFAQELAKFLE